MVREREVFREDMLLSVGMETHEWIIRFCAELGECLQGDNFGQARRNGSIERSAKIDWNIIYIPNKPGIHWPSALGKGSGIR